MSVRAKDGWGGVLFTVKGKKMTGVEGVRCS